jgi:glycosyltransferase involved in cell wall biosynthesis
MRAADVLVVPSSYEGFGIVYLEVMGFGLPAIATTAGAAGEIISDGVDGFLVPPGDAATLAARIATLARDRALLAQMSAAAGARFARQPTWEQSMRTIRTFLIDITKSPRPAEHR